MSGLNIFDIKNEICSASRDLLVDRLEISENWTIDYPMLGSGNPSDLLTESNSIVHITLDPSDNQT